MGASFISSVAPEQSADSSPNQLTKYWWVELCFGYPYPRYIIILFDYYISFHPLNHIFILGSNESSSRSIYGSLDGPMEYRKHKRLTVANF